MLKLRLITASILLPFAIWLVFFSTVLQFSCCITVILGLAAWEWTKLCNINNSFARVAVVISYIVIAVIVQYVGIAIVNISNCASIIWGLSIIAILGYPNGAKLWQKSWITSLLGIWLFVPAGLGMVWIKSNPNLGILWLAFLCFLVCSADSGAYFMGKGIGVRKLAPQLSAKKTWAGVAGGFLAGFIVALLFSNIWLKLQPLSSLLIISIFIVAFSIIGDLIESLFKRVRGVKDSGNLLPGHGGILDRIDSFLAAVPIFITVTYILGIVK